MFTMTGLMPNFHSIVKEEVTLNDVDEVLDAVCVLQTYWPVGKNIEYVDDLVVIKNNPSFAKES